MNKDEGEYFIIRNNWEEFYKAHFKLNFDFSQVFIPKKPYGKWQLLFIPKDMTLNFAYSILKLTFNCNNYLEKFGSFDNIFTKNVRNTCSHYAIWFRDEPEPDQIFLGESNSDYKNKIGITLLERFILEIKYFTETGKHYNNSYYRHIHCNGTMSFYNYIPNVSINCNGIFNISWKHFSEYHRQRGFISVVAL